MVKRKASNDAQLSLFENKENRFEPDPHSTPSAKEPSVVDFIRAQFERNPEMSQEEYKRWIKILVQSSIRRMS